MIRQRCESNEQWERRKEYVGEAGVTHFAGPMLGAIRPDGAAVWIRSLRPAHVEVRVAVDGQEKPFGPVESTNQTDLTVVVTVTGPEPGMRYPYRVLVDCKPINAAALQPPQNGYMREGRL